MTVYFAQEGHGRAIKIGWTINLDSRLAALRTTACAGIELLAQIDGDKRTESYFHNLLADYRSHGEWFNPTATVLCLVDRVKHEGIGCVPIQFRMTASPVPRIARDTSDIVAEAKQWICEIAAPQPLGENFVATLKRVAALAGVSPRAIKAIWYDETKQLSAHVYVGLKECFDAKMARVIGGLDRT